MGTRRSSSFHNWIQYSRKASKMIQQLRLSIEEDKPAKIIVKTAISTLAASNPPVAMLLGTYKASKIIYEVSTAAHKAYKKNRSPEEALEAASKKALKIGVKMTRKKIIGMVVDKEWSIMKRETGLKISKLEEDMLTSLAKNTLDEVLPI